MSDSEISTSFTGHLRLIWPQWQGASADNAAELVPEVNPVRAHRGYAVGARVLDAVLPEHSGPSAVVDVPDDEQGSTAGIESRNAVIHGLRSALRILEEHAPERVLTLGGECSVSVAPFAALQERYGDDLAIIWIDAHPDSDTADTGYDGYHAMAVSTLLGHGDPEITELLPATVPPARLAYAGLHDGEADALAHLEEWQLTAFGPNELRTSTRPLLDWLTAAGASKVAIHIDVDVVDSNEAVLGLGAVPGGLSRKQVHRIVADVAGEADVVGLTLAEFIPRSVLQLQELVDGLPLIGSDSLGASPNKGHLA
ncbi:MAG: arginase family protein [Micrococcaceae bacterium]